MILIPVTAAIDRVRAILEAAVRPEGRLRGAMAISPSGRGLPVRGFPTPDGHVAAVDQTHLLTLRDAHCARSSW